ncbi:MAG: RNA-binding cell elongation regulator Jag/EloR [Clostridia bacterium]
MRSVQSSAKTMEDAVTQGLEKLGVSFADVKIDILDEGSKGFLGLLGGKPVVVRLTVREDVEEQDVLSAIALNEAVETPEKTNAKKAEKTKQLAREKAAKAVSAPKGEKTATAEKTAKPTIAAKPASNDKPVAVKPAVLCDAGTIDSKAQQFLMNVTKLMGVEVSVNVRRDEEGNMRVDMFGDTLGILIGRRGETLDALQYLTSLYINRGQDEYTRVTLDTENYRSKREEALTRLANRMANRAVKTGRKVVMEPMNPYERRILHSALQQNDAVTTHSEGDEPNRHVVITLK